MVWAHFESRGKVIVAKSKIAVISGKSRSWSPNNEDIFSMKAVVRNLERPTHLLGTGHYSRPVQPTQIPSNLYLVKSRICLNVIIV